MTIIDNKKYCDDTLGRQVITLSYFLNTVVLKWLLEIHSPTLKYRPTCVRKWSRYKLLTFIQQNVDSTWLRVRPSLHPHIIDITVFHAKSIILTFKRIRYVPNLLRRFNVMECYQQSFNPHKLLRRRISELLKVKNVLYWNNTVSILGF